MAARTFWTATVLLALAATLALGLAIADLRRIAESPTVDIAVPRSAWRTDAGRVAGRVRDGLPPYALHWDGQPPAALLVDARTSAVLAAAVFSDQGFDRSRNAVRFADGEVRFVLDARRWPAGAADVIVRVEAVRPRGFFTAGATLAALLTLTLMALVAFRRHAACPAPERPAWWRRAGWSAVFIAIAIGAFIACYPGAPVRVSDFSDESNINSYAAASDHPERFVLDKLLSDPRHFRWYIPAYIAVFRGVKAAGFHYATGEAFVSAAVALFMLFGMRRLFTAVSGNARFGVAAALGLGLMSATSLPANEGWSLLSVVPRTLFTALLPWVLLLALRCAPSSRRWWIACAAAGALVHVHPLSAPALVGALLVAFVVASDEPWPARARGTALGVMAAIVTMLPFVIIYTARYRLTVDVDPAVVARSTEVTSRFFARNAPAAALRELIAYRVGSLLIGLDLLAIVLLFRCRFDAAMRFYLGLLAGFVVVTIAVPVADDALASYLGRRPYELELMRNIRYADMFLVGALALGIRGWSGGRRAGWMVVIGAAALASACLGPGWFETARAMAARGRLSWRIVTGRPDRESGAAQEAIRAVSALRSPGERVLGPVGLRQFDIPLACVEKDLGVLAYSPSRGLIDCADRLDRARRLLAGPITERSLDELSAIHEAPVVFLFRTQLDAGLERSARVMFENEIYAIVHSR